jgi:hypothetical protein
MGVKDLCNFISKYIKFDKKISIFELTGKKIAIDISIYRHRDNYTQFILELIRRLVSAGAVPIIVFDICSPAIKMETQMQRSRIINNRKDKITDIKKCIEANEMKLLDETASQEDKIDISNKLSAGKSDLDDLQRNMFDVKPADFDYLSDLFTMMGIITLGVPFHESEGLCSHLNRVGYVDYVMSEDQDVIPYGAKKWLRKYDRKSYDLELCDLEAVEANFTHEKILLMALLLGNDYFPRVYTPLKLGSLIGDPQLLWDLMPTNVPIYKAIIGEYDYDYANDDIPDLSQLNVTAANNAIRSETAVNQKKIFDLIYKYVPKDANEAIKVLNKIMKY